jgi:flagellar hook-associated protein 3 FlgL
MRVTFGHISHGVQSHINKNLEVVDKYQRQLASGRRLNRPSDDPVAASNALDVRTSKSSATQYRRNVDDSQAYLATVDSTVASSNEILQRARELAIQGSNDTMTPENRKHLLEEAKSLFEQLAAIANTTFRGEYLFSGTNTQEAPYELRTGRTQFSDTEVNGGSLDTPLQLVDTTATDANTANGNPDAYDLLPGSVSVSGLTEGRDFSVNYRTGTITFHSPGAGAIAQALGGGISISYHWMRRNESDLDGVVNREVEQDNVQKMNTTASEVFGATTETTVWDALVGLMRGLHLSDSTVLGNSLNDLDGAMSRNLQAMAANGARVNMFESAGLRQDQRHLDLTSLQSKLEDVDFAEAITQLSLQQAVYEASLKMGAQSIQMSLANFL